jgi:hypothetical protein
MGANIALGAVTIFGVSIGPAFAYLDPGTGSIIVQAIIGAVGGGLVLGRMYWQRFKALFGR